MKRSKLKLAKETIRILRSDEIALVAGGYRPTDTLKTRELGGCTGVCGSGGCSSLLEDCPATMNCGL